MPGGSYAVFGCPPWFDPARSRVVVWPLDLAAAAAIVSLQRLIAVLKVLVFVYVFSTLSRNISIHEYSES